MTSLLATRRRAEDFARLVEGSRRSHDPNVAPLLDLVAMLRPAGVQPSEVFRTSLREHLLTVAADLPRSSVPDAMPIPAIRSSFRTPTRVRIVAVALAVALAGGMVGTAAAARNALPGELLYPIKRGLEHSEAAATTNAGSRGREYLGQATSRLGEVSELTAGAPVGADDLQRIALSQATLGDFAADVRQAGNLLIEAAHQSGRTATLIQLREFVAETTPQLRAVKALLPAPVDDAYADALTALTRLDQRVLEICPQCTPGGTDGAVGGNAGTAQPSRSGSGARQPASPPSRSRHTTPPADAGGSQPGTTAPLIRLTLPLGPLGSGGSAATQPDQTGGPAQRQTAGPPTGTLSIPLPNPTSLPLPLPSKLPLPTSLPLPLGAAAKPHPQAMSLPWLLPYGGDEPEDVAVLPPGLLPNPVAPLLSPGQARSHGPDTKPSPSPGATKEVTPSPSPTVLPFPGGDDGATPSPSPTSGDSIFDKLFGPLLPL